MRAGTEHRFGRKAGTNGDSRNGDEVEEDAGVFAAIGGEAVGGSPSIFASLIREEIPRWRRVAKEAGVHIE